MALAASELVEESRSDETDGAVVFEGWLETLRSDAPAKSAKSVRSAKALKKALGSWLGDDDDAGLCTVKRGSLTMKERNLSLASVAPADEDEEREDVAVPLDIPRSTIGFALRHTEGHELTLHPLLESVRIPDVPDHLSDALHARVPRLKKGLSYLNLLSMAVALLLAPLALAFTLAQ